MSTDEIYGALGPGDKSKTETDIFSPNSPYAASKASADHLVRAWNKTYGLNTITVRPSNNYGPRQHPEKLIPKVILNAMNGAPIPLYGNGENLREWLHVSDHCRALLSILNKGKSGAVYNIGSGVHTTNNDLARTICDLIDTVIPTGSARRSLITYVEDRAGHDFRYALDSSLINEQFSWLPSKNFKDGLIETIEYYKDRFYVGTEKS